MPERTPATPAATTEDETLREPALTRFVRKLNRINPVSALSSGLETAGTGLYRGMKEIPDKAAYGGAAVGLGLGTLLLGLPILAFKGIQKAPEWLGKGFNWMEKNIKEFSDFSPTDSQLTTMWSSAQDFTHKYLWRIKKPAHA